MLLLSRCGSSVVGPIRQGFGGRGAGRDVRPAGADVVALAPVGDGLTQQVAGLGQVLVADMVWNRTASEWNATCGPLGYPLIEPIWFYELGPRKL